jgi:hypothetical protein
MTRERGKEWEGGKAEGRVRSNREGGDPLQPNIII